LSEVNGCGIKNKELSFYDISIVFRTGRDGAVFFVFHFIPIILTFVKS
jgi:hypothetical protein